MERIEPFTQEELINMGWVVSSEEVPDPLLHDKSVTYTKNGTYEVLPDAGFKGMGKADVTVDLPLQAREINIVDLNTEGAIFPDEGYEGLSDVVIRVHPPIGVLEEELKENGTYVRRPDYNPNKAWVEVTTKVSVLPKVYVCESDQIGVVFENDFVVPSAVLTYTCTYNAPLKLTARNVMTGVSADVIFTPGGVQEVKVIALFDVMLTLRFALKSKCFMSLSVSGLADTGFKFGFAGATRQEDIPFLSNLRLVSLYYSGSLPVTSLYTIRNTIEDFGAEYVKCRGVDNGTFNEIYSVPGINRNVGYVRASSRYYGITCGKYSRSQVVLIEHTDQLSLYDTWLTNNAGRSSDTYLAVPASVLPWYKDNEEWNRFVPKERMVALEEVVVKYSDITT